MNCTRRLCMVSRLLGGALLLALLFLPSAVGHSAAAPIPQSTSGYWQYVETINNSSDQAVDPQFSEKWSPQFSESSTSGIHTIGDYVFTGSCSWSYESDGGIDSLVPGQVVVVHLSAEYAGVDPALSGNQLTAYACFNAAGVMGSGVYQGATCTDMLTIPGPGGSRSLDLPITIDAGPLFPDGGGALEVKCCPGCYKSMSVQRVYQWVEAPPPAGSEACGKVSLNHVPDPPVLGADLFLGAEVDPSIGSAQGFSGRWVLGETDLPLGIVEKWDGCSMAADYYYTCGGQEYVKTLFVPGKNCGSSVGWRLAVGAGLAAAIAAAAAALARRRTRSPSAAQYILHLSTNEVRLRAGQSAAVVATVYEAKPSGPPLLAVRAPLRVSPAPGLPGLDVAPKSGTGSLAFKISVAQNCPGGTGGVSVEGSAGRTNYAARVKVDVEIPFTLEVKSHDPQNLVPAAPGALRIQARVVPAVSGAEADAQAKELTAQIDFVLQGDNAAAVKPSDKLPSPDGWQQVRLTLQPDKLTAAGDPTLVASVTANSSPLTARLALSLQMPYAVEIRHVSNYRQAGRGAHRLQEPWPLDPVTGSKMVVAVALDLAPEQAVPPQPAVPDEKLSSQVQFQARGANHATVRVESTEPYPPAIRARLGWVPPQEGRPMDEDDPELVAQLSIGPKKLESSARLDLSDCRLALLRQDLETMAQRLRDGGYYVRNPYLGGPTGPIADGINQVYGITWDWTVGWAASYHGTRCEDYIRLTNHQVTEAVRRAFGSRARLTTAVVKEKSSISGWSASWDCLVDTLDSAYTINHILYHLTLPNHHEYGIDFWEHFRSGAPVMMLYSEYKRTWLERLKGDIDETAPIADQARYLEGKVPRLDAAKRQAMGREQ